MKYFLGILGIILVLIFVVVLAVRGGGGDTSSTETPKQLTEYAAEANTESVLTNAGAINAEENHRVIQITVTDTARTLEVLDGYNGKASLSKTFSNTTSAFEAFLGGLQQVGFTKTRKTAAEFTSVCPIGTRNSYKLVSGDQTVVDGWSASCQKGSYGGNVSQTERLFQAQIPDYQNLVTDVSLNL